MQWLELTIHTRSEKLDDLTARLTALGYDSLIIEDEEDFIPARSDNHALRPAGGGIGGFAVGTAVIGTAQFFEFQTVI